jgi:hypothetical protein
MAIATATLIPQFNTQNLHPVYRERLNGVRSYEGITGAGLQIFTEAAAAVAVPGYGALVSHILSIFSDRRAGHK